MLVTPGLSQNLLNTGKLNDSIMLIELSRDSILKLRNHFMTLEDKYFQYETQHFVESRKTVTEIRRIIHKKDLDYIKSQLEDGGGGTIRHSLSKSKTNTIDKVYYSIYKNPFKNDGSFMIFLILPKDDHSWWICD